MPAREYGCGIDILGIHHGRNALQRGEQLRLLPFIETREAIDEALLQQGRRDIEQKTSFALQVNDHPPAILGIPVAHNQATFFEAFHNVGDRCLAEAEAPGNRAG
jgi:hypothetical protein